MARGHFANHPAPRQRGGFAHRVSSEHPRVLPGHLFGRVPGGHQLESVGDQDARAAEDETPAAHTRVSGEVLAYSRANSAMMILVSSRYLPLIGIRLLAALLDHLRHCCEIVRRDATSKPEQSAALGDRFFFRCQATCKLHNTHLLVHRQLIELLAKLLLYLLVQTMPPTPARSSAGNWPMANSSAHLTFVQPPRGAKDANVGVGLFLLLCFLRLFAASSVSEVWLCWHSAATCELYFSTAA